MAGLTQKTNEDNYFQTDVTPDVIKNNEDMTDVTDTTEQVRHTSQSHTLRLKVQTRLSSTNTSNPQSNHK